MPRSKEGKLAWWNANKDRPEIRERHNAAALAYYYAHKDEIKAAAKAKRAAARAARMALAAAADTPAPEAPAKPAEPDAPAKPAEEVVEAAPRPTPPPGGEG